MPRRDRTWPAVLSPPPRWQIGNLELIVGKYNTILQTMLDVEQPLLLGQARTHLRHTHCAARRRDVLD